jgi:hypothetical protein
MTVSSNEQVVFRDYPLSLWLLGVVAIVGAFAPETVGVRLIFGLMGIAAIGLISLLTVTFDHTRGTLSLHYRSLLRVSTKTYAWNEICFVNVKEDRGESAYRVELILRSGQVVPLRSWYSSGRAHRERQAQQLRSVLRVGGVVLAPGSSIRITISKS